MKLWLLAELNYFMADKGTIWKEKYNIEKGIEKTGSTTGDDTTAR